MPNVLGRITIEGHNFSTFEGFAKLSSAIKDHTSVVEGASIDDLIVHLQDKKILERAESYKQDLYRTIIFACLGWQTMLYQPALNTCSFQDLAVHQDDEQPDSGLVFADYRVPTHLSDRPLSILLKCFGNLLPARSSAVTQEAAEMSKSAASWLALWPEEINAYLLQVLLRVRFRWVDSLCLYLDYDKSTQTLLLFAYPSLCVYMLQSRGVIFAFSSIETGAADPRADRSEIESFLREVLLSYRLLFAQSAKARKVFRRISSPSQMPHSTPDTLLATLCTMKQPRLVKDEWFPEERTVYYASKDFGTLCDRVELLARELEKVKPRSMGDLIHDRRDKMGYWTFWLISIIGGIGIILSTTQVVLQGIQLAQGG